MYLIFNNLWNCRYLPIFIIFSISILIDFINIQKLTTGLLGICRYFALLKRPPGTRAPSGQTRLSNLVSTSSPRVPTHRNGSYRFSGDFHTPNPFVRHRSEGSLSYSCHMFGHRQPPVCPTDRADRDPG